MTTQHNVVLPHSGIELTFKTPTPLEMENLKLYNSFAILHSLFSRGLLKETQKVMAYVK